MNLHETIQRWLKVSYFSRTKRKTRLEIEDIEQPDTGPLECSISHRGLRARDVE
jgi:hypothetical protein